MPVYTVHAPGASGADLRSTDKFAFVRDGFHFWAAVFGPLWLIWHRLWLALIGWIIAIVALELALIRLGVGSGAIFFANVIVAILMGFEAASLQRWTFTWHHWRQLDVVVADDEETAEFSMLESLREFAAEQLASHAETEKARSRHAAHYAGLAARSKAFAAECRLPES